MYVGQTWYCLDSFDTPLNHIKGKLGNSIACFDMTFLQTLTWFLPRAVTFAMDITEAAILLRKEIKKIDQKLTDGSALSHQKRAQLNHKRAGLVAQLQAVLAQL